MSDTESRNNEYIADLRARFTKNGASDLTDEELLCLLLSFTNVKSKLSAVAEALIERFQHPTGCYRASYSELMAVEGMTRHAAVIVMLMGRLAALRDQSAVSAQSVQAYEEQFLELLRYTMREELWAAAIDGDGTARAFECLSCGSDISVDMSVGALMRYAVKSGAKAVIIAHSHPGAAEPDASHTDIHSMKCLGTALSAAGVTLEGQIIVAGGKAKMYHIKDSD